MNSFAPGFHDVENLSSCQYKKSQIILMNYLYTAGILWKGRNIMILQDFYRIDNYYLKTSVPEALQSGSPCGVSIL